MDGQKSFGEVTSAGERCGACGTVPSPGLDGFAAQHRLTGRELQVARCAASGSSNHEIAEHLALSVRTVENHLQRVYDKAGVHSRTRLAVCLLEVTPTRASTETRGEDGRPVHDQ